VNLSNLQPWITPAAVIVGFLLTGYVCRAFVLGRLEAFFSKTPSDIDDLVLAAIRRHVPLWFLLGGLATAAPLAPLSESFAAVVLRVCSAGFVLSLSFAVAYSAVGLLDRSVRKAGVEEQTTSLAGHVLRFGIVALGGMLVLSNLGISITPILTALGVGSLAVALALQPTLSNLFAGVHIAMSRPIKIGDFVELESGAKGFVDDIGWRATTIRELPNNLILVPNARVAEMVVTNFSLPATEQSALVQVGVSYSSDLRQVERVTREVAAEVLRDIEGGVDTFEPFIRYHTFGDSSINFSVILRVKQFVDRYLVIHEFHMRLKERFDREGIEIPFPQRVVHLPRGAVQGVPAGAVAGEVRSQ
jgi:small-conductance mechanosensitive channel